MQTNASTHEFEGNAGLSMTAPPRGRVQKIFNFSQELAHQLRDEAARRSRETGRRVTEKLIVVEALEARLSVRR